MSHPIALAFVGSVVPDRPEFRTEAFSPAGNMFQENLLAGLQAAGFTPPLVLSCRVLPAYPRDARLLLGSSQEVLACGVPVELAPLLNVIPFKQLLTGFWVLYRLLIWGWQHRAVRRIVYTYNLTMPPGLFTLLAARCIGAKAVASINDINEPGENVPRTWPWRLDFAFQKILLPRFDGLIVVSDAIRADFAPAVRYLRVEGGLSAEMVADASTDAAVSRAGFHVVFAGLMNTANGVEVMLRAISQIPDPDCRFIFAGGGPLSGAVRLAAREDPRIDYRGLLKLRELLPIYKQADVLINMRLTQTMRSRYCFPSKLMELLASGTPVISTCTGHVEEEYGDVLLPLRDETPEGLAAAIQQVAKMSREERRTIGGRARAYMLTNKTWSAQGARIGKFLAELVGVSLEGSMALQ